MGKHKTKTTGKGRLDKFYYLAKEQGFRSRAAFKLVQLDRKFHFLTKAHSVLDLCAAPGGWMQVAAKHMPVGGLIIGIDLVPIRSIRGAITLQEDITTSKCKAAIKKVMKEQGHNVIEVILHDGSPNVGGAWSSEATSQAALVLDSLKLAVEFLAPGGTFVSKVFRSQDYTALLYAFKQLFEKVEVTKPVASRATSAEIYVVGLKYRAPGKIDLRLLDSRHLFQEVVDAPKVVDVLRGSKQKRHREGYEEGKTILFKKCAASDFVWAEKPLELLGTITSITFLDPSSDSIKNHPLTTKEVTTLCEDLRVLGKQEFKQILKWRLKVRDDLKPVEEDEDVKKTEKAEVGIKGDEDDNLLAEMAELEEAMDTKKKRAKKLAAKRKAKAKARTATGMQVDVMDDQYGDEDLFALAAIKAKRDLASIEDPASSEDDEEENDGSDHILNNVPSVKSGNEDDSNYDSAEERERYDAELDEYLEEAYDVYCKTTDGSTARRKRAKLANADKHGELWEEGGDVPLNVQKRMNETIENEEENPLLVDFRDKTKPSKDQLTERWFSQDIFTEFKAQLEEKQIEELVNSKKKKGKTLETNMISKDSNRDEDMSPGVKSDNDMDFEVVPAEHSGSEDSASSDDESDYNDDAKAETLAYAKKMLHKKSRESILDDAYNRYTFDDEGLPRWFLEDEKKHSQPMKPITKEDVEAMKAQFRVINARPVRKVAEAKARKKRRAAKKLEQVRRKATEIVDQDDISSTAKGRQLERLYAKATAVPKKAKREIVVAKKGVGAKGGKGSVIVDRRMKSDLRQRGSGKMGKGGKLMKSGNMAKGPSKKGTKGSRGRRN